jgi:hypothetical protein
MFRLRSNRQTLHLSARECAILRRKVTSQGFALISLRDMGVRSQEPEARSPAASRHRDEFRGVPNITRT